MNWNTWYKIENPEFTPPLQFDPVSKFFLANFGFLKVTWLRPYKWQGSGIGTYLRKYDYFFAFGFFLGQLLAKLLSFICFLKLAFSKMSVYIQLKLFLFAKNCLIFMVPCIWNRFRSSWVLEREFDFFLMYNTFRLLDVL